MEYATEQLNVVLKDLCPAIVYFYTLEQYNNINIGKT